ncbi:hypothetical protein DOY81_008186 [Sarcophaga bullata]|nr:hypothetical protein DOY81_008186 [Sarcophaga bullata]
MCLNLSVHKFNFAMAKLLSATITQFTTSSHYTQDDSIFIPVDFQAIRESTQMYTGNSYGNIYNIIQNNSL